MAKKKTKQQPDIKSSPRYNQPTVMNLIAIHSALQDALRAVEHIAVDREHDHHDERHIETLDDCIERVNQAFSDILYGPTF